MNISTPQRQHSASLVQHRPGLWMARAPLVHAAAEAASRCPEAFNLAADADWAERRRLAFQAGRAVAALALQALGRGDPVGRDAAGAPQWPPGCVGSIAHDDDRAVAVVADAREWLAIGVDVEPDLPLPADAASIVLLSADRHALAQAFGHRAAAHERLVFSAKECVHKAIHPWRGVWLEFDEVAIHWQSSGSDHGQWQALPLSAAARQAFFGCPLQGEWWRAEGALWALLSIRCSDSAATCGYAESSPRVPRGG